MKIGVLKEIKVQEHRVALTPAGTKVLVESGHEVRVETGAGGGSGFADREYEAAGAKLASAEQAWASDLILKVKEPLESEYPRLARQIVFTYFHLAGVERSLTETLLDRGTTAVAYETVEDTAGRLPLLAPMSAVAGNMAITIGNHYLAKVNGGKGVLLGQVLGSRSGKVVVLGDGIVGQHAARAADRLGAEVHIAGLRPARIPEIQRATSADVRFFVSEPEGISEQVSDADVVVGAVLVRGSRAPVIVTEAMVRRMQPGSVVVDVSIDQGGCVETSHPTSHADPVFVVHGVTHYCVANMPGAYPRTSTIALTDATLPYAVRLANEGVGALRRDRAFAMGLSTHEGRVTSEGVASALGMTDRYQRFGDP
jgi:alanine dehydrogenase